MSGNRVRTFEADEDEQVVMVAGTGEMNRRTIFSGHLDGRYAVVPIDELEYDRPEYAEDLDIGDLEVLGRTATIEPADENTMTLLKDDEVIVRGSDPGVYGLLRIPFERA